jgi:hypothetical protein
LGLLCVWPVSFRIIPFVVVLVVVVVVVVEGTLFYAV